MIGVLSDAHGNITAFRSAISHLKRLGAKEFYYLGDALGYIPTTAVLQELMNMGSCVKCILGNHEVMVLSGCTNPKRESVYQHQLVCSELTAAHRDFLGSWPTHHRETIAKTSVLLVHGSPYDFTNEYVYPDTDLRKFHVSEDFVLMGHSHYPFVKEHNGTTFVNVGSCGLPRDDGRYGAFLTFDPHKRQVTLYRYSIDRPLEVTHRRVHPSVHKLFERMANALIGQVLTNKEVKS
jgi:putative phosphoesterase